MDIVTLLKAASLFKGCPEKDLDKLAEKCRTRVVSPGQTLFLEGEKASVLYLILKGALAIKKGSGGGDDEKVTQVGQGEFLGELGFLDREKRSTSAEATESSEILEIPYDELDRTLTQGPQAGLNFYRNLSMTLAGRIRRTTGDLAGLRSLRLRH